MSLFRWHREEELRAALVGFEVDVTRFERGLRWRCTKSEVQGGVVPA